jgi:protein-glutamine gamma-glutamyltransferase
MTIPPMLLGGALLFWGWQTGLFWLGAVAALAVETPRVCHIRWQFSQADLDRIWNLCVALFLGATIYAFFSADNLSAVSDLIKDNSTNSRLATLNQSKRSLFQLLQWLPLMFLPTALAHAYSENKLMDLSTFSWWLRRRRADPGIRARYLAQGMDIAYPYFACCLFAASAANQRTLWFSLGLLGLAAWALWQHRSRGYSPSNWVASLALAAGLGVVLQLGAVELQKVMQRLDEALFVRWGRAQSTNAKESQTRIGAIGDLKLSGRIVLRVRASEPPPPLLREASYDLYRSGTWSASKREFNTVATEANQSTWVLRRVRGSPRVITIAGYLPGGSGLLALPSGVFQVADLPAGNLSTNCFGATRVEEGPDFVQFESRYLPTANPIDTGPSEEDGQVPLSERPAIFEVARQLGLTQQSPGQALHTVEQFLGEFKYSTWQGDEHRAGLERTALGRFLLETRSGHCEYFATATVLLLRAAGIPARYATGYAVEEKKGRYYVVRERHAHAWCLAWIDNRWREVDTTPAAWSTVENGHASLWEPLRDLLSRVWFEFSRWRWGHAEWKRYLLWLVVPLLALALGKLLFERQWQRARNMSAMVGSEQIRPGQDSEFYVIQARLVRAGFSPHPGETGSAWLSRVARAGGFPSEGLRQLLEIHYRLRFDPRGLTTEERRRFRRQVTAWLQTAEESRPAYVS